MKKNIKDFIPFNFKYILKYIVYLNYVRGKKEIPVVKGFEETVNRIIDGGYSVSRFGDGEFKWIFQNREEDNFEKNSSEMAKALSRVIKMDNSQLMLCVPDVFRGLEQYNKKARIYWFGALGKYGKDWLSLLNTDKTYYDTQFTRPYMDYIDKSDVQKKFSLLKKIWQDRDILIVEGDKTRFGVGNDLINNAHSVTRILCPAVNAFERYQDILPEVVNYVNKMKKKPLVLISLGPTATVLSADLCKMDIQAIDIGHLDVEYSWSLLKAVDKIPLKNKYVNENPKEGHNVQDILDDELNKQYTSQIVGRIK